MLASICLVFGVSSCAARIPVGQEFNTESETHVISVEVPFVTNRSLASLGEDGEYFSDEHGECKSDDQPQLGRRGGLSC